MFELAATDDTRLAATITHLYREHCILLHNLPSNYQKNIYARTADAVTI